MSGCLGSTLTDKEVAVGDTIKDTQYFFFARFEPSTHQECAGCMDMSD